MQGAPGESGAPCFILRPGVLPNGTLFSSYRLCGVDLRSL